MKRLIGITLILFFTINYVSAQSSIGFSNPEDIRQVLDYRLPDWGYSNFFLDFSLRGRFDNSINNRDPLSSDFKDRNFNFVVSPGYDAYWESEQRIFSLNSNALLLYSNSRSEEDEPADLAIQKGKTFSTEIDMDASLKEYVSERWFFLIGEDASFEYRYGSTEDKSNGLIESSNESYNRRFISNSRVGIGFGRVRNVNPVIRAVRLSERYKTIADGSQFSGEEVRSVADEFTKFQGYQNRYDRPEKHFWESMDNAVNSSISDLNSFDIFYLTDVLDENIGTRLQGWDASIGGMFSYSNSLSRQENNSAMIIDRDLSIGKTGGFFGEARWFKNLSMKHQIGFTANYNQTYPIDSNLALKWNMSLNARGSWLWNLTDRFLLNTQLINSYNGLKLEENSFSQERRNWSNSSILSGNLVYFIENQLAMNAGISSILLYQGGSNSDFTFDQRMSLIRFEAGIRYYFERNLY